MVLLSLLIRHYDFVTIQTLQKQQNIDLCNSDLMSQDFYALIGNIRANLHLQFAFVFVARSSVLNKVTNIEGDSLDLLQNLSKNSSSCPNMLSLWTEFFLIALFDIE